MHSKAFTLAVLIIATKLAVSAFGADPMQPLSALQCKVIDVHDGDSLTLDINLGFGVVLANQHIRAWGYDAWEVTRTRQTVVVTDEEIAKGKAARDELTALLKTGTLYVEDSGQHDPYGRTSAVLWLKLPGGWLFVANWMDAHGHLRTPRAK